MDADYSKLRLKGSNQAPSETGCSTSVVRIASTGEYFDAVDPRSFTPLNRVDAAAAAD
jgi:hypothetical protein